MSPLQRKILSEALKFQFFYCGSVQKKGLIPDTRNGRQWALERGATHFSTLSFNRPDGNGLPPAWRWGDFYFRIEDRERTLRRIKEVLCHVMTTMLRIDTGAVKATYLGPQAVGITIPRTYFEKNEGVPSRPDHYQALARILKRWLEGTCSSGNRPTDPTYLRFHHDAGTDADNRLLPFGGHAVPLPLNEYLVISERDLKNRSIAPRDSDDFRCEQLIPSDLLIRVRTH